jgi:hypothetical protein
VFDCLVCIQYFIVCGHHRGLQDLVIDFRAESIVPLHPPQSVASSSVEDGEGELHSVYKLKLFYLRCYFGQFQCLRHLLCSDKCDAIMPCDD